MWGLLLLFFILTPDCWLEVMCLQQVLRMAKPIKTFLGPGAKVWMIPKYHSALHISHKTLPITNFKPELVIK